MKFIIRKEDLFNGIKIVERATSQKAVQPVLYNILIETLDNNAIRLTATDLVLTVITTVDAQIEQAGKITLPAKKLNEIVSKLGNELVTFEVEEGSTNVNISCKNLNSILLEFQHQNFLQRFIITKLMKQNALMLN